MSTMTLETIIPRSDRLHWRQVKQTVVEWRRRARSRAELMSLSDRNLHDLGVFRATANGEASKPFWMS
jgi:uncharacterized protein YjiS (DUF1127 family)